MVFDYFLLFAVGLIGGFLAGLIGIGGGVMYVLVLPYLILQMGFPESEIVQYTIANSLVGTMFAALAGNIMLIWQGVFPWKEVLLVGLWAATAAIMLLKFFVNTEYYQVQQFNVAVIALMVFIIYRTLRQNLKKTATAEEKKVKNWAYAMVGGATGAVSALSGLGGGTIIIPMLNSGFNISIKKAKSISLGVICLTSFGLSVINFFETPASSYQNQSHGYIIIPLALIVSLGVIIGSPFGVKVAHKLSNRIISLIFVLFVVVVIIDKLWQLI